MENNAKKVIDSIRSMQEQNNATDAEIAAADAIETLQVEVARFQRALEIEQNVSDNAATQAEKLIEQRDVALARLAALPDTCDGKEQEAFEAFANADHFDMSQHPLHYLFLNSETSAARQGWKAAILYCRKQVDAAAGASPAPPSQARELSADDLNDMWECALAVANPTAGDAHLRYGRCIIAAIKAKE